MVGFPLIKRRATTVVAHFRETLSATSRSSDEGDGQPSSGPGYLRFYGTRAHPASRISGSDDDTSQTMARARFLSHAAYLLFACDKKRAIAKITGACWITEKSRTKIRAIFVPEDNNSSLDFTCGTSYIRIKFSEFFRHFAKVYVSESESSR